MKQGLKNREAKKYEFLSIPSENYELEDNVLVYFDGQNWKIIRIVDLLQYPIVHDIYYDGDSGESNDISITFCPFSFSGIVYFGKYFLTGLIKNNNIIIKKNDSNFNIQQLSGKCIDKCLERNDVFKNETIILKLRTALESYPDGKYFNNLQKIETLVDLSYIDRKNIHKDKSINNHYHPKKLVYGIISSMDNKKYVVVLKGDKNKSFDFIESGYSNFFEKNQKKFRDKGVFIVPVFWFSWIKMFPNSKVIEIK